MKKIFLVSIAFINLFLLFSCNFNFENAPDIEGVWAGTVESEYSTDGGVYIMEFMDTGRAKHGGSSNVIREDSIGAPQYNWSINADRIKINSILTLYYAEYIYELSEDGTVLILTLSKAWKTNSEHDYFEEGDIITFLKSEEEFFYFNYDAF